MSHRPHYTYDGYCWYWNCTCGAYARGGADSEGQCRDRFHAEHATPAATISRGRAHKVIT